MNHHQADVYSIVHFDATVRRKEKMRAKAEQRSASQPISKQNAIGPAPAASNSNGMISPAEVAKPVIVVSPPVSSSNGRSTTEAPNQTGSAQNGSPITSAPIPASSSGGAGMSSQELEIFLVNFVVDQTGYPPEMVELDADLEADLGIDSIKKAQMLGEMAEQIDVNVEINEEMSLDDFPTLRDVLNLLTFPDQTSATSSSSNSSSSNSSSSNNANGQQSGNDVVKKNGNLQNGTTPTASEVSNEMAPATPPSAGSSRSLASSAGVQNGSKKSTGENRVPPVNTVTSTSANNGTSLQHLSSQELETFLVNFVVDQTGYPPEMVELDADLEADLGIDSIKKAQMLGELAEQIDVKIEISEEMSLDDYPTLQHIVDLLAVGTN